MMSPLLRRGASALALVPLLLLAERPAVHADEPSTLVVLEEDEPQTTYPFLVRTMSEVRLAELLFDRMFQLSLGGSVVSPVFEPGWTVQPPNLTVQVKDGLTFADGTPATFSDVAFSFNDVYRRTDLGHELGGWYGRVFGDSQQITPTTGTVRFGVTVPDQGAERYLLTTSLLSRASLTKNGTIDLEGTKRQPNGTGPFFAPEPIESFDDVLLRRSPNRPVNPKRPPVTQIRLLYDRDAASQKELMEGGRADVWISPPPAVIAPFANQDRYGKRPYDLNQWWYVAVNHANGHLKDSRVRTALDHVVPRGQLVEKFGGDTARLTSGPFLPTSAWVSADSAPTETSRDIASQLMTEAGYAKSGGTWEKDGEAVVLRLGVQGDILDDYNDVVYGMVDAWEDAGFRVRLRSVRAADWRTQVENGKASDSYDLLVGRWNIDREEGALDLFMPNPAKGRRTNLFDYSNDEVNDLSKQYYDETSGPKREALMQKLHGLLQEDRPYLFLWTLQVQSLYRRDKVAGLSPAPFYYFTSAERLYWKSN